MRNRVRAYRGVAVLAGVATTASVAVGDEPSQPRRLTAHTDHVMAVAFSPDGATLASASKDTSVRLWSTRDWAQLAELGELKMEVFAVAFSPNGKYLAAGGGSSLKPDGAGYIRLWEVQPQGPPKPTNTAFPTMLGRAVEVAFLPNSRFLVVPSRVGYVNVFGVPELRLAAEFEHSGTVAGGEIKRMRAEALAVSPDGECWAIAGATPYTGRDALLYPNTATDARPVELGYDIASVCFSLDGKRLAIGRRGQVEVIDVAATLRTRVIVAVKELSFGGGPDAPNISVVRYSPDGHRLAVAAGEVVTVWKADAPKQPVASLRGHTFRATSLAFSPDGRWLAVGCTDNSVRVWDLRLLPEKPADPDTKKAE